MSCRCQQFLADQKAGTAAGSMVKPERFVCTEREFSVPAGVGDAGRKIAAGEGDFAGLAVGLDAARIDLDRDRISQRLQFFVRVVSGVDPIVFSVDDGLRTSVVNRRLWGLRLAGNPEGKQQSQQTYPA